MSIAEITVEELASRLNEGIALFDVREVDEYVEGHAPGAVLIPLSQLGERGGEFPSDGEVYVICKSGGRSMRVCEFLDEREVHAINIAGGTGAWIRAGYGVVTGSDPT
jgi:rhodanese-related sulfurtransferase